MCATIGYFLRFQPEDRGKSTTMSHRITRRQACVTIPAAAAFALHASRSARAAGTPLADDIARSKKESHLEIYSNVGTLNWEIIVKAFNQKYPWIRVEALDIGPEEAFERYYAESASGHHSADVIVAASPTSWLRFIDKGELMPVAGRRRRATAGVEQAVSRALHLLDRPADPRL